MEDYAKNDKISLDDNAKFNLVAVSIKRSVENLITEFCKFDMAALLDLSIELLKLEHKKELAGNDFINKLFYGQLKPDRLRQIICSNFYNKNTGIVEPIPE